MRMQVFILFLFGLFAFLSPVCKAQSHEAPSSSITDLGGGNAFVEPSQEQSASTTWPITMNAAINDITFGWLTLKRRTYNGGLCGPTWKVKRGDTISVTLNNDITDSNNNGGNENQLRYPDKTNLHTHGLHISGECPYDDVTINIDPGKNFPYTYNIDADNPPGTYWYHSHRHGSTMFQVHSGMAGMIVVEDSAAELNANVPLKMVSCPANCDHDVQLVFQPALQYSTRNNTVNRYFSALQRTIKDNEEHRLLTDLNPTQAGLTTLEDWMEANIDHYTVNGRLMPTLTMAPGQMKRFRMVNAGGADLLELYIVKSDDTVASDTECSIREIAIDGVYLDAPRVLRLGQTLLVPAQRVDWMVKCSVVGTYKLKSDPLTTNGPNIGNFDRFSGDVMTIEVTGSAVTEMTFPTTLTAKPDFLTNLQDENDIPISQRFVVELASGVHLNRELFGDPTNFRHKMEVGKLQEWTVLNADPNTGHPLHIHVNHFQVIRYNEYIGPYSQSNDGTLTFHAKDDGAQCNYRATITTDTITTASRKKREVEELTKLHRVRRQGPGGGPGFEFCSANYIAHHTNWAAGGDGTLAYAEAGAWRDTLLVPPLANITIRFKADEYTGKVIMHCHILIHEDLGMMMAAQIVEAGEPIDDVSISVDGMYPGTCTACDYYPPGINVTVGTCSARAFIANTAAIFMAFISFLLVTDSTEM